MVVLRMHGHTLVDRLGLEPKLVRLRGVCAGINTSNPKGESVFTLYERYQFMLRHGYETVKDSNLAFLPSGP